MVSGFGLQGDTRLRWSCHQLWLKWWKYSKPLFCLIYATCFPAADQNPESRPCSELRCVRQGFRHESPNACDGAGAVLRTEVAGCIRWAQAGDTEIRFSQRKNKQPWKCFIISTCMDFCAKILLCKEAVLQTLW